MFITKKSIHESKQPSNIYFEMILNCTIHTIIPYMGHNNISFGIALSKCKDAGYGKISFEHH